jgi:hypothetical protein
MKTMRKAQLVVLAMALGSTLMAADANWRARGACPWTIRWAADRDTACDKSVHLPGDPEHSGMAIPGESPTRLTWQQGDRREYAGDWPGLCPKLSDPQSPGYLGPQIVCTLPSGHQGRCAP